MQQAATIIAFVVQCHAKSKAKAQLKLQSLGHTLSDVGVVLKEYSIDMKPVSDDDEEEEEVVVGDDATGGAAVVAGSSGSSMKESIDNHSEEDLKAHKAMESVLLDQWADQLLGDSISDSARVSASYV